MIKHQASLLNAPRTQELTAKNRLGSNNNADGGTDSISDMAFLLRRPLDSKSDVTVVTPS